MENKTSPGLRKSQAVPLCVAGGPTGSGGHKVGLQNRGAEQDQPFLTAEPSKSAFSSVEEVREELNPVLE